MEKYKPPEEKQPLPLPEANDSETAIFFAEHLDKPCEVEVAPGDVRNMREHHLRLAKEALKIFTNPGAKRFLEMKIEESERILAKEKQEQK